MHRYYTTLEGRILVWNTGVAPLMQYSPYEIFGNTAELEHYFNQPEAMVYVPWDVVRVLTEGM